MTDLYDTEDSDKGKPGVTRGRKVTDPTPVKSGKDGWAAKSKGLEYGTDTGKPGVTRGRKVTDPTPVRNGKDGWAAKTEDLAESEPLDS